MAEDTEKTAVKQTVIIPASGDVLRMEWALAGLAAQVGAPAFEVLVVGDVVVSDSDDVEALVARYADRLPVRVLFLPPKERRAQFRVSAARNLALAQAQGEQAVFLDEDCCPDADCLASHWEAGKSGKACYGLRRHLLERMVIPFPGAIDTEYIAMYSTTDGRVSFAMRDVPSSWYGCNASAPVDVVRQLGGFKTEPQGEVWGNEDLELAQRLDKAKVKFVQLDGGWVTHLDHPRRVSRKDHEEITRRVLAGEYADVNPEPITAA